MSKILSDLKQSESNHFQEELAKTYFSTVSSKEARDSRSQQISKDKKRRNIFIGTAIGLLIFAVAIFFVFDRIVVNIKIIPSFRSDLKTDKNLSDITYLNKNGELNMEVIKNVVFYENAANENLWGKSFITLSNVIASKKAALGIDFAKPLNLKENLFCFYSKGKNGGEELRVSLRDINNNFCNSKINKLETSWQSFIISASGATEFIDPENITHIDFEVNPSEKQNLTPSTTYLKDIYLTKRRE